MSGANAHHQLYQIRQDAAAKQESITVYYPHHPYYRECLPVAEIHFNGNPPDYICTVSQTVTLFIPKCMTYPHMDRLAGGCLKKDPGLSGQPNTPLSTTPGCLSGKTLLQLGILQHPTRHQQGRQPVTCWSFREQLSRQDGLRRSEGLQNPGLLKRLTWTCYYIVLCMACIRIMTEYRARLLY